MPVNVRDLFRIMREHQFPFEKWIGLMDCFTDSYIYNNFSSLFYCSYIFLLL